MMKFIPNRYIYLLNIFLAIIIVALIYPGWSKQGPYQKKVDASLESYMLSEMHACFQKVSGKNQCYNQVAVNVLKKNDLQQAITVLEKNQDQSELFQSCHEMGHFLGREEYKRTKKVNEALSVCTPVCFAGCFHGVLEGHLIEKKIGLDQPELLSKEITKICGLKQDYAQAEFFNQCLHGLGHALMFLTNANLPTALKLCDNLQTKSEQDWCYSGSFMENSTSSTNKDHPSKYLKADDILYPCNSLDGKYLEMCYALQSFYFADVSQYDWQKTISLCLLVPTPYQETCIRSVGQNLVGFSQDFNLIKNNCYLVDSQDLRQACIQGVILALSSKYGGDFSKMMQFCEVLDISYKRGCYSQVGISSKDWLTNIQDLKKVCSSIREVEYQDACLKPL